MTGVQTCALPISIRFSSDHILDFVNLEGDYDIYEVDLPERWVGMSVGEIDIRKKYGINIIAALQRGRKGFKVECILLFSGQRCAGCKVKSDLSPFAADSCSDLLVFLLDMNNAPFMIDSVFISLSLIKGAYQSETGVIL